jgi:hypothetical protein
MALFETTSASISRGEAAGVEYASVVKCDFVYFEDRVANGGNCLVNSRPGARFITIFTAGLMTGHGNAFIICCVPACERNVDDTNNRRQAAWTAKASNAAQFLGNVVLMQVRRSMAVNAIFWWTYWDYC